MKEKLHHIGRLYLFIFALWGLYRLIFRLPENVEEIILKPLIWLIPTFYIVFKIEKKGFSSLGYSLNTLKLGILRGLEFGLLFLVVGLSLNYLRYGQFSLLNLPTKEIFLPSLLLSFITAISEETVFRGYIMSRLRDVLKSWGGSNFVTSIGYTLIHLPIIIFVFHYSLPQIFIFLTLIFLTSLGSGLLYSWTGSIWSSILVHVFWSWPIVFLK